MSPRRMASLVHRLMLLVALAAGAAVAEVRVTDDAGHSVTLPGPATRIVSLTPHLTELVFAAGAGDRLVGASAWSDYPAAARQVARIGDSAMLDLERIVALRPDLVLVWGNGSSAQQLQQLKAAGLRLYVSEARSLAHIATTLRRIGTLAGTETAASARATAFEQQLATLRTRFGGRQNLWVFYQIWHQPLMTVNGAHIISQALGICGASNLFSDLKVLTPTVSAEAVMQADPDAIVTGSVDPRGADNLDQWRRLKTLRAAQPRRLLTVNPDLLHRSTDRIVDGIEELCVKLDALR